MSHSLVCVIFGLTMANTSGGSAAAKVAPSRTGASGGVEQPFDARFSWGDFDGDGLVDLYAIRPLGEDRLFRNAGGEGFVDVTDSTGLAGRTATRSALWADHDRDGRLDLLLVSEVVASRLFRNLEGLSFEDVTETSGLLHGGPDLAAAWLDYDGDGELDLWFATATGDLLLHNAGGGSFERARLDLPEARPAADDRAVAGASDLAAPAGAESSPEPGRKGTTRRGGAGASIGNGLPVSHLDPSGTPMGLLAAAAVTGCTRGVIDQALPSSCIQASSSPTLGKLFPLGTDLNVSPSGRVGMGTTSPSAGLHVQSEDGLLAAGTLGSGSIPAQGTGTRMMWYPGKAALRVGYTMATEWNDANIGVCSSAMGYATKASGVYSTALGLYASATGGSSVALGDHPVASGGSSVALGSYNYATGSFSTALGFSSQASASLSTTMGLETKAESYAGTALGRWNVGGGNPSLWVATDPLFEVGNGASAGSPANALTILKNGMVGIGTATPESALHVQEGSAGSVAAVANSSAVLERSTHNFLSLLAPAASETGVIFGNPTSNVQGGIYYNEPGLADALVFRNAGNLVRMVVDSAGRVGVGTSAPEAPLHVAEGSAGSVTGNSSASAVFERNGHNYINLLAPDANETGLMFGNPTASSAGGIYYNSVAVGNGLAFRVNGNSTKMSIAASGNVGIGTITPGFLLEVAGSAGKPGGGSWSVSSDARLKRDVERLQGALEKLLALRGVTFEYIDPCAIGELEGERMGLIAQEVERVFPDWVDVGPDGFRRLTVRGFEALAVEALRELRAEKEAEIRALRAEKDREIAELRREFGERVTSLEERWSKLEAAWTGSSDRQPAR